MIHGAPGETERVLACSAHMGQKVDTLRNVPGHGKVKLMPPSFIGLRARVGTEAVHGTTTVPAVTLRKVW